MAKKVVKSAEKTKIPEGVYLAAAFFFMVALSFLSMSFQVFVNTDNPESTLGGSFEALSQVNSWYNEFIFVSIGVVVFIFASMFYFIGRGLLKLENRSRMTAVVLLSLGITLFVILMFVDSAQSTLNFFYTSIFLVILQGVGIWYLTRKDIVKKFN